MIELEEKNKMISLAQKMEKMGMHPATIMESLTAEEVTNKALKILGKNPTISEREFKKQMGMK